MQRDERSKRRTLSGHAKRSCSRSVGATEGVVWLTAVYLASPIYLASAFVVFGSKYMSTLGNLPQPLAPTRAAKR